jgi:hypothetical protein
MATAMKKYMIHGMCVKSDAPMTIVGPIADAVAEIHKKHGHRVDTMAYALSEWLRGFGADWHADVVQCAAYYRVRVPGTEVQIDTPSVHVDVYVPCGEVDTNVRRGTPNFVVETGPPSRCSNPRYDAAALVCVSRCVGRFREETPDADISGALASVLVGEMARELGELDSPPWSVLITTGCSFKTSFESTIVAIRMPGCAMFLFMR